jgi:hypothetical protein
MVARVPVITVTWRIGIEQIDLMPVFEGTLMNYYDCFHSTSAGASVVATAVGATIVREPIHSFTAAGSFTDDTAAAIDVASCVASRAS